MYHVTALSDEAIAVVAVNRPRDEQSVGTGEQLQTRDCNTHHLTVITALFPTLDPVLRLYVYNCFAVIRY